MSDERVSASDVTAFSPGASLLEQGVVRLRGGTIKINHMEFTDNSSIEGSHFHRGHEIYYCMDGVLRIQVEATEHLLTRNQFVIVPPRMRHRVFYTASVPSQNFLMLFQCQPNSHLEDDPLLFAIVKVLGGRERVISGTDSFHARQAIEGIFRERSERRPGAGELLEGYYLEFLTQIFRNYFPAAADRTQEEAGVNLAVQITQYLKENHMRDLTLQEIADAVHVTPRHADRVFLDFFGFSVMNGLQSFRVIYAQKELEETEDSLEQIAERVGFTSVRQMQQVFREREGISPGEYRKQCRK